MAMAEFGSSDSGASLGDILGAALKEKSAQTDTDEEIKPEADPKEHPNLSGDSEDAASQDASEEEAVAKVEPAPSKKKAASKKKTSTKKKAAAKKKAAKK